MAAALSRRRFLQVAGAAAAAVPASRVVRRAAWLTAPPPAAAANSDIRVVIAGAGIAGLGCAYRLWRRHGIRAAIYEYDDRFGGRIETLHGYFDGGQIVEQHGEFVSSEHTEMLALAASFGLTLDNALADPPHLATRYAFGGRPYSQHAIDAAWSEWGWGLFHDAAFKKAKWPALYNHGTEWARRWDHMSVPEWIEAYLPGGLDSDFGRLCNTESVSLFGAAPDQLSALNLVYMLGFYSSVPSGVQPRHSPVLSGSDDHWHIHGGNDQVVTGILDRLPAGAGQTGQQLLAVRSRGSAGLSCTFQSGSATYDVAADHVVLTMAPTKLAEVDLAGVDISALHRRAISEQKLGTSSKIQLQFASRPWYADHENAYFITDTLPQSGWEVTNYQPGPAGILLAYPGGARGEVLGAKYGLTADEGPAPAAMVSDYLAALERLYPGVRAAYNGKAYYQWSPGDIHIGGAYSYLKPGQFTGFNGIQGQREGNLHFAGEATSINFPGFMEGGLRSGYRVAKEIAGS